MNLRKAVLGALAVLAIGSAIACGDEPAPTPRTTKTKAPAVVAPPPAQKPDKPNVDDQQQPAPAADPGAHNTQPGKVGIFVSWESENKDTPACEWQKNGVSSPCAGMKAKTDPDGIGYYGFWEYEEAGTVGTTYGVFAHGTGAVQYVTCEIAWKGRIHEGTVGEHRCGISYTLE